MVMTEIRKCLVPIGTALLTAMLMMCSSSAGNMERNTETGDTKRYPLLNVSRVEYGGALTGLSRGIIGAPDEMYDRAVKEAGDFSESGARMLRTLLRDKAGEFGFKGESAGPELTLKVRVIAHIARIGEIWPHAEYLVEAEYVPAGLPSAPVAAREVFMYYHSWFYWTIDSVREDVLRCLSHKIIGDIFGSTEGDVFIPIRKFGKAVFPETRKEARGKFFGEDV